MTNKTFYEIIKDMPYNKKSIEKLPFRMDVKGPIYQIAFGEKYKSSKESIEKDDYILRISNHQDKEIKDKKIKESILARLVYHHKNI